MTTQPTAPKTAVYWTVKVIVTAFMIGAAAVSFLHIVHTAAMLGLGIERWTVPFIIDGLAVLGLIGRSPRWAESTRRAGLKLTLGAGVLSLAANIAAGENLGQRIYGALIVAAFITAEWYGAKLSPAPVPAGPAAELAAKRSAAAVKAAATRKRNAELAAKAERAETRRIRQAAKALEAQAA